MYAYNREAQRCHRPTPGRRPHHAPSWPTINQRIRKRIEGGFGYIKTVAVQRKTRYRGTARVGFMLTLAATAYNLARILKLLAAMPR
ncbi:transposase [Bradyrhizobium sp. USDA 3364]